MNPKEYPNISNHDCRTCLGTMGWWKVSKILIIGKVDSIILPGIEPRRSMAAMFSVANRSYGNIFFSLAKYQIIVINLLLIKKDTYVYNIHVYMGWPLVFQEFICADDL